MQLEEGDFSSEQLKAVGEILRANADWLRKNPNWRDDLLDILIEVLHNPFRLVNCDELARVLRRSRDFVLAAKNAGAPFPGGVTRPEWFLKWLQANPGFYKKAHNHAPKKKAVKIIGG